MNINNYTITQAITRWNKENPNNPVPDSATRAKTSLLANKIFLAREGDQVRFRTLNFMQRIVRYVFGCYSDTIFKDKDEKMGIRKLIDDVLHVMRAPKIVKPVSPKPSSTEPDSKMDSPKSSILNADQKSDTDETKEGETCPTTDSKTEDTDTCEAEGKDNSSHAKTSLEDYSKRIAEAITTDELYLIKNEIKKEKNSLNNFDPHGQKLQVMLAKAESKISAISYDKYKEDFIPEEILNPTFDIAKYGKAKNMEQVRSTWTKLQEALKNQPTPSIARLNLSLAKEILSLMDVDFKKIETEMNFNVLKVPCMNIPLSQEIMQKVDEELKAIQIDFDKLEANNDSLEKILSTHIALGALKSRIAKIRKKVNIELADPALQESLISAMRKILIKMGAEPSTIEQYLNPANQDVKINRIFDHTVLNSDLSYFSTLNAMLRSSCDKQVAIILAKIMQETKTKSNLGGGDCYFYSCRDLIKPEGTQEEFRALICKELTDHKEKYEKVVLRRFKKDNMVSHLQSYEDYCDWIAQQGHWGSEPELQAISSITQRPVIVIQNLGGGEAGFSKEINLHFKGEPLLFFNHSATHYEALVKD